MRPFILAIAFLFSTAIWRCESSPPTASEPIPLPREVEFHRLMHVEVEELPSGLAVSPDGGWLVSLGFGTHEISVYDARTLELIKGPLHKLPRARGSADSLALNQPHSVVISPDSRMAVLGSRNGAVAVALPSLEVLWTDSTRALGTARYVIRDRPGKNYYVSGDLSNVVRFSATGEMKASFEVNSVEHIALSNDEQRLLILTDSGSRLQIVDSSDLQLKASFPIPFSGAVIVPLLTGSPRAVVVGAAEGAATGGTTPVLSVLVNIEETEVGIVDTLCCTEPQRVGRLFLFGDGNKWARVGEATAVLLAAGTVTVDMNVGSVSYRLFIDPEQEHVPCCDVASYPNGSRLIVADAFIFDQDEFGGLVVYDVEETTSGEN